MRHRRRGRRPCSATGARASRNPMPRRSGQACRAPSPASAASSRRAQIRGARRGSPDRARRPRPHGARRARAASRARTRSARGGRGRRDGDRAAAQARCAPPHAVLPPQGWRRGECAHPPLLARAPWPASGPASHRRCARAPFARRPSPRAVRPALPARARVWRSPRPARARPCRGARARPSTAAAGRGGRCAGGVLRRRARGPAVRQRGAAMPPTGSGLAQRRWTSVGM